MPKVLSLVTSCGGCSNRHGRDCSLAGSTIVDLSRISGFCPLTEYPSGLIADLEYTLARQRELIGRDGPWTSGQFVIMQIAIKLNVSMNPSFSVTVTLSDGSEVVLMHDHMMSFDCISGYYTFVGNDGSWYQVAIGQTLGVRRRVDAPDELKERDGTAHLWQSLTLK